MSRTFSPCFWLHGKHVSYILKDYHSYKSWFDTTLFLNHISYFISRTGIFRAFWHVIYFACKINYISNTPETHKLQTYYQHKGRILVGILQHPTHISLFSWSYIPHNLFLSQLEIIFPSFTYFIFFHILTQPSWDFTKKPLKAFLSRLKEIRPFLFQCPFH